MFANSSASGRALIARTPTVAQAGFRSIDAPAAAARARRQRKREAEKAKQQHAEKCAGERPRPLGSIRIH